MFDDSASPSLDLEKLVQSEDNSSSSSTYRNLVSPVPAMLPRVPENWEIALSDTNITPVIRRNFVSVHISQPKDLDNRTLGETLVGLSPMSRLIFLWKNRPIHLIYLFIPIFLSIYYAIKYVPQVFLGIETLFIHRAHAEDSPPTVVNGVDYTPWFFVIIVGMTFISTYAALFSKNEKSNDHGWDLLKVLLGSSLGLFPKAK